LVVPDVVVGPKRWLPVLWAAFFGVGVVVLLLGHPDPPVDVLRCKAPLSGAAVFRFAAAAGLACGGWLMFRSRTLRRPCMIVAADTVSISYVMGQRRYAAWSSLGPFEFIDVNPSSEGDLPILRARVTGHDADPRTLASGKMWVPIAILDIGAPEALALLNKSRLAAMEASVLDHRNIKI
jgi:hypothetical protein